MRNVKNRLTGVLLAALAAVAISAPAGVARANPTENIVLVHGAWADGSGWTKVYQNTFVRRRM